MHNAYDFALSFDCKLVSDIIDRLGVSNDDLVLDPFCGTGTTIVECKQRGIRSIGVDANPVCALVARAKLDWGFSIRSTQRSLKKVEASYRNRLRRYDQKYQKEKAAGRYLSPVKYASFAKSVPGKYLSQSGMLKRGWISPRIALKSVFLSEAINSITDRRVRRFFLLCFLGLLVPEISNMRYGPEIYRARRRRDVGVVDLFANRVHDNLRTVEAWRCTHNRKTPAKVIFGDSVNGALDRLRKSSVGFVITSPPYPNEHDYTRLTRLELVFAGFLNSPNDVRKIKRRLLRCCTRNIYCDDSNSRYVARFRSIQKVIGRVEQKAQGYSHGFARLYGRVTGEYFGSMLLHLKKVSRVLKPGGMCAYVVGDQASFFSVQIKTAELLSKIAASKGCGLKTIDIIKLGSLKGTRGRRRNNFERLLLLRKEPHDND
jgi:DNA modification methylase